MSIEKSIYSLGDEILSAKPFCHVISLSSNGSYCDTCGKPPGEDQRLQRCANCKYESYCSRLCQKASWDYHKFECPLLKAKSPKIPTDSVRLFLKLVWLTGKGKFTDRSSSRTFSDLCSHVELMSNDKNRCTQFAEILFTVTRFAGEQNLKDLVNQKATLFNIFGRMAFNTFTVTHLNDPVGIAIYLEPSKFNHSCVPNAVNVYDGVNIRISAIREINTEDEPILINYIDPFDVTANRKKELQANFYFTCTCVKCSEDDNGGCLEDFYICPHCFHDYPISDPVQPCLNCGNADISDGYLTECHGQQHRAEELLSAKPGTETTEKIVCFVNNNKCLSDSNIRVQLLHAIIYDSGVNSSDSMSMLEIGQKLEKIYPMHYPQYFPMIGIHLFKQGRHAWNMNDFITAAKYLIEARRVLLPTHGHAHTLIKTIEREVGECKLAQHMAASPDVIPTLPLSSLLMFN